MHPHRTLLPRCGDFWGHVTSPCFLEVSLWINGPLLLLLLLLSCFSHVKLCATP